MLPLTAGKIRTQGTIAPSGLFCFSFIATAGLFHLQEPLDLIWTRDAAGCKAREGRVLCL